MKESKLVLLGCAVATLTLTFVAPYLDLGAGLRPSLWGIHTLDPSLPHTFGVLITAAVVALVAGIGVLRGRLGRGLAALAVVASAGGAVMAYAVFVRTHLPFSDGAIGAKLILACFVIAGLTSLSAVIKPDRGYQIA